MAFDFQNPWGNNGGGGVPMRPPTGSGGGPGATTGNPGSPGAAGGGGLGQFAPQPYQSFGQVPSMDPAMIGQGDVGSYLAGLMPGISAAMGPEFAKQTGALNENEASRGIYDSSVGTADNANLQAQQFADMMGMGLPIAQQDVMANQASANDASRFNATAYGDVTNQNMNAYNNWGNMLAGAGLGSYSPDPAIGGMYGNAATGAGNAYQNAYNNQQNATNNLWGDLIGAGASIGSAGAGK
jgi:hypothetical protein